MTELQPVQEKAPETPIAPNAEAASRIKKLALRRTLGYAAATLLGILAFYLLSEAISLGFAGDFETQDRYNALGIAALLLTFASLVFATMNATRLKKERALNPTAADAGVPHSKAYHKIARTLILIALAVFVGAPLITWLIIAVRNM